MEFSLYVPQPRGPTGRLQGSLGERRDGDARDPLATTVLVLHPHQHLRAFRPSRYPRDDLSGGMRDRFQAALRASPRDEPAVGPPIGLPSGTGAQGISRARPPHRQRSLSEDSRAPGRRQGRDSSAIRPRHRKASDLGARARGAAYGTARDERPNPGERYLPCPRHDRRTNDLPERPSVWRRSPRRWRQSLSTR